ncbi:MAG: zinc ribbon domain-containing protein, partial [Candidatus Kariarchaeaceae archaeon]
MVYTIHSHHNPDHANYKHHVIGIRGNDFCTGCLASKVFLIFVLPVLFGVFIYPNYLVSPLFDWSILASLWMLSLFSFGYEIQTGRSLKSSVMIVSSNTYFFGSILYVAFSTTWLSSELRYTLILLFASPQVGIYLFKSISKSEFNHGKLKFASRLLFIISFFFSLLNLTESISKNLMIVALGTYVFIKLRRLSSLRADPSAKLVSVIDIHGKSIFGRLLKRLNIYESDGQIRNLSHKSLASKIYLLLAASILYAVGLVLVTSPEQAIDRCASDPSSQTLGTTTPWLFMSSGSAKSCNKCGNSITKGDRFCLNCG